MLIYTKKTRMSHSELSSDPSDIGSVANFYEGKNVFLTGGTGFIGKVIVEKLLRGCANIKNIYLLVRPKKGASCEERIQKMFSLPLFKKLMETSPDAPSKIVPIPGDIVHQGLGISDDDRQKLRDNVDIVIHSAAAVRFNEPIRIAMEMNCIAVKEIIKLVKELKHLQVFCHISTAYSQCHRASNDLIAEKFYPSPIRAEKLMDAMEWMSDDVLNNFIKPLIDKYPNTYTFTKALAESMLEEHAQDLPLVIVRPSIVCSSVEDPIPGWIDNYNGVSGIIVAIGRGILRTIYCPERKHDMVPVDLVSNCIIVSVWYHGMNRPATPLICNCTSGNVNPTSFLDMEKICQDMMWAYPYNSFFRRPNFSSTGHRIIHSYWQVVSHYIPATIADGCSMLVGSKPKFMNIYRKINKSIETLQFFISNEWSWGNTEYNNILTAIPSEDRENFDFDMRKIDWKSYYEALALGVKVYVLKDDLNELPKAKRLMRRHQIVRWTTSILFCLLAGGYFFTISVRFQNLLLDALSGIERNEL